MHGSSLALAQGFIQNCFYGRNKFGSKRIFFMVSMLLY